jgi:hypothetical protein
MTTRPSKRAIVMEMETMLVEGVVAAAEGKRTEIRGGEEENNVLYNMGDYF